MPRAVALVMMLLAMAAWSAQARAADDRRLLDHCKALVAQAQPQASTASEGGELRRCQQIIREWALRDSRMSVDEKGRPLH
jgi:hypothetical protein